MSGIFNAAIFNNAVFNTGVEGGGGGGGGGGQTRRRFAETPRAPISPADRFARPRQIALSSGTSISWRVHAKSAGSVIHAEPVPVRTALTVVSAGTQIRIRVAAFGHGVVENDEEDELVMLGLI